MLRLKHVVATNQLENFSFPKSLIHESGYERQLWTIKKACVLTLHFKLQFFRGVPRADITSADSPKPSYEVESWNFHVHDRVVPKRS